MTSGWILPCGCSSTQAEGFGLIEYVRCAEHYKPEDDERILQAIKNKRALDEKITRCLASRKRDLNCIPA